MSKHVLVIESDAATSQALEQAFGAVGVSVEVTSDGAAGIASAKQNPPALVVLAVEL